MIFESTVLSALFFGLISAGTLPLGAAIGVIWRPPDRTMAVLLAYVKSRIRDWLLFSH
jgi:zinc transporter ZupT